MTLSPLDWTLPQKIGQMIVVRASGYWFDHQIRYPDWEPSNEQLQQWLETLNLGGVILLGGSAVELATRAQQLQKWANTPLLLCADIEEGVGQRFAGATWFPPLMALGDIAQDNLPLAQQLAYQMGQVTAREALAIGINWMLAPVVDVNNNPENPVINVRSLGDDPEIVAQLASAYIKGGQTYPILTTAKHFPGHGDTSVDSHLNLPILPHDTSRLASVELPPFEAAIAAGVDSIMTAHLSIPVWDDRYPATLSQHILTKKLREKMGFKGIIVTDALIMGGITQNYSPEQIAVKAVAAGVDILLMPNDPNTTIMAICQAVKSGEISEERINTSINRIWRAKSKVFPSFPKVSSPVSPNFAQLSQPQATEVVNFMISESLKTGGNLPLLQLKEERGRNLIIVDDLLNCAFLNHQSPCVTIPQKFGYFRQLVDYTTLSQVISDKRPTLVQIFLRGNPFRGSAGLTPAMKIAYEQLWQTGLVQGMMIYGSPYVLDWFRPLLGTEIPWVFSYGQMANSQAIALKTLFNETILDIAQPESNFGF